MLPLPASPDPTPTFGWSVERAKAQLRVGLLYLLRHGRIVRWSRPGRFTEWVQWRKLHERDPRIPPLMDKLAVKDHVESVLGPQWVTPTLFEGDALPERPGWDAPFVVKARHASNRNIFVRTPDMDWEAIRSTAAGWCREIYGLALDEWLYRCVPRGIVVEPFLDPGGALPVDYKVYVFGGRARCIKVDLDRETDHWRAIYDLDWRPLWSPPGWRHRPPPESLDAMIAGAEQLGADFDFVRVDFYDLDGSPRFGEMTFYPGSGLSPLPRQLDYWLGGLWWEARRGMAPAPGNGSGPAPAARRSGRPGSEAASGVGRCRGHHGELLQGAVREGDRTIPCLVSVPMPGKAVSARLELFAAADLEVVPPWKHKALKAARLALDALGRGGATGRLTLDGAIAAGLGLGSSTADVVAAIRAAADCAGASLPPEAVAALAVRAELASDPLMFDGPALLYAQREGRILESWGDWYPDFQLFSFPLAPAGAAVDTLALARKGFPDRDLDEFGAILADAREGFRTRDLAKIASAATRSAALNQRRLPLARFEPLLRLAGEVGALGVQIAHSGIFAGMLFDAADPDLDSKRSELAARTRRPPLQWVSAFRPAAC
ncbi:MAG TPA: ATP-grasp fold amidoligase family protein [Allosphingosinicella sp.]|jgi:uncharacterized protein involved in propanediol utilization|nr:ATP-grasp fold amidoligase family protein [Allosphingosinicella sp.]